LKKLATFVLLFASVVLVSDSFGWTRNFYSQIVKDSIMLSPPEVQLYFTAGKEAVGDSISRLAEGDYDFVDSQDAFISAIASLRGRKKDATVVVTRLLDLVWYVSDAAKPALDDSKLAFVAQRAECFCVLFDGYERFVKLSEVLGRTKGWLSASTGALEEFYMFGEVDLEEEAARSFEVIYNTTVNLVVDTWYSVFTSAGVPVNPCLSCGARVFPKGPRPPLQPVELKYRMKGFKEAVYGLKEEKPQAVEFSIEEKLSSKSAEKSKGDGEAKEESETVTLGEAVSLIDLMEPTGAETSGAERAEQAGQGKGGSPVEQKPPETVEHTAPPAQERKRPEGAKPEAPGSVEKPKEPEKPQTPSEKAPPEEFETTVEADITGSDAAGLAEKAKQIEREVGAIEAGEQEELDLEGIFAILESSGAQTSNGREFKLKNSGETPEAEEFEVEVEDLNSEHKVELSEKVEIKVESPVFVPLESDGSQGDLDFDDVSRVISDNIGGVKFCYELGLKRNPSLTGKAEIEFTIGENGRVVSARVVSSTLNDSRVESCILRKVRSMRFPAPEGGKVTVKYPFVFEQSYQF